MEQRTIVRCAAGHLFSVGTFPLQNLGARRIGPGRLVRCPCCGRLRSSVPEDPARLSAEDVRTAHRRWVEDDVS
jgi:4-hydroxy-3-methylbut-2-en-1-yl diphosphate synthase IspG/GcpE